MPNSKNQRDLIIEYKNFPTSVRTIYFLTSPGNGHVTTLPQELYHNMITLEGPTCSVKIFNGKERKITKKTKSVKLCGYIK